MSGPKAKGGPRSSPLGPARGRDGGGGGTPGVWGWGWAWGSDGRRGQGRGARGPRRGTTAAPERRRESFRRRTTGSATHAALGAGGAILTRRGKPPPAAPRPPQAPAGGTRLWGRGAAEPAEESPRTASTQLQGFETCRPAPGSGPVGAATGALRSRPPAPFTHPGPLHPGRHTRSAGAGETRGP